MAVQSGDAYETLSEALADRAGRTADEVAFHFVDPPQVAGQGPRRQTLSYAQLDRGAAGVAARLVEHTAVGDRVVILCEPGAPYVASLFGCLYAGCIAVPTYPPIAADQIEWLRRLIDDSEPALVLTSEMLSLAYADADLTGAIERSGARSLGVESLEADAGAGPGRRRRGEVAMLQYTSGSTGSPRGVILDDRCLLANVRAFKERVGQLPGDRGVSWLPPYHDMGLIGGILSSVVTGIETVSISPLLFLKDPLIWMEEITRAGGSISGGPNFAYDLCVRKATEDRLAGLDLSSWRVAVNGAEPVRAETMRRFARCFEPCGFDRGAFTPAYGLAEATLAVSMCVPGSFGGRPEAPSAGGADGSQAANGADRDSGGPPPVALGRPIVDTEVAIVHPETHAPRAQGEVGEIWVDGPCVAAGYWGNPGQSADVFSARVAGDPSQRRYLRTGDLGTVRGGELFVTGRLKDLIIVRGSNHYPQDLEETAGAADERLRTGCTAAFQLEGGVEDGAVIVVQECARGAEEDAFPALAAKVRAAISARHGVALHELVLIEHGGSLKTSSGKIRRQPTREAYLQGELPILAATTFARRNGGSGGRQAAEPGPAVSAASVAAAFAGVLGIEVRGGDDFFELGGDSLDVIELTVALEEGCGVHLDPRDVYRAPTPERLAAALGTRAGTTTGRTSELVLLLRGPISPQPEADAYPVSPVQRRWAADYLGDTTKTWGNLSLRVPLPDEGDPGAAERALAAIWGRHESLRTLFAEAEDGSLRQRIPEAVEVPLRVADLGDVEPAQRPEAIGAVVKDDVTTRFDLVSGPAARATLIRCGDSASELHLAVHHMLADGWSVLRLRNQLGDAYAQARGGAEEIVIPEPRIRYRDYSARMLELEREGALKDSREYWLGQLDGDLPATIPVDEKLARSDETKGASLLAILDSGLAARLAGRARAARLSLTALLYAGFFQAIHQRTRGRDLIVGTPLAGRERPDVRDVIGMFINLVPIRMRIRRDWDFTRLAEAMQMRLLDAMAHQHYQLDHIVDDLGIEREKHRFPITNTFFTKLDMGFAIGEQSGSSTASKMATDVRFQTMMYAYEFTDGLVLECKYRDVLFPEEEVRGLMDVYVEILENAC